MEKINKFLRLTPIEKALLFEAVFTSVVVKLIVLILPLRFYSKYLGIQQAESSDIDETNNRHILYIISKSIVRSRKVITWKNRCMVEAITAKKMLKRRGLASTLYFGVSKENQKMAAHAWLRCGSVIVTGKQEMEKFVVVSTFA